jgi:hypothetical protein
MYFLHAGSATVRIEGRGVVQVSDYVGSACLGVRTHRGPIISTQWRSPARAGAGCRPVHPHWNLSSPSCLRSELCLRAFMTPV